MENKTNSLEFILFSVGEFLEFQDRIQEKFQTTFMKEFQRRQRPRAFPFDTNTLVLACPRIIECT